MIKHGMTVVPDVSADEAISDFDNEGFVIFRSFLDAKHVENSFNEILRTQGDVIKDILHAAEGGFIQQGDYAIEDNSIKYMKNANLKFPSLDKLISSRLVSWAQMLLQCDVFIDGIELHQKHPGVSITPPHQDNFYFCLENGLAATAYIALNKQVEENGALAVIPSTHNETFEHHKSDIVGFSSGINPDEDLKNRILAYELNPGDVACHQCNIVHLAPQNISNEPRVNIAVRFRGVDEVKDGKKLAVYQEFLKNSVRFK